MNSLSKILQSIKPLDEKSMSLVRERQQNLTKPHGSLGRLEELSVKIAGIKAEPRPVIKNKAIITIAADHGVVAEGITLYPQEVTGQMLLNFLNGGAAINVLARHIGARVIVVDMGVIGTFPSKNGLVTIKIDPSGTKNMAKGPAMTHQQAIACLEAGIDVVMNEIEKGLDILGTGEMGIGNTTASSAVFAAISGKPVAKVTGRGTGIGDSQLDDKIKVIKRAIEVNKPDAKDPIDVLTKLGGFEIGGLAGAILCAAANRIPVVVDGFISSAAALIATQLSPAAKNYLIASHLSHESGHRLLLQFIGLEPLLSLNMRLGEGTGAALGINIVDASIKILNEMATFAEAGVSESE